MPLTFNDSNLMKMYYVGFGEDDSTWGWVLGLYQNFNQVRFVKALDPSKKIHNRVITRYISTGNQRTTGLWGDYNDSY